MSSPETEPFDWSPYAWLEPHADKLAMLAQEYRMWNERVNLVSRKEIDLIEARHILPCAAIGKLVDWGRCQTHLDIGTGGGLPGLVIALLFPKLECTLLDSTAKKLRVIEHIAGMVGLDNVRTVHGRVETHRKQYDLITGRAVTALPRFLAWARGALKQSAPPGGLYYWKGGALEPELDKWKLPPDECYALEPILQDAYFEEKYIVRYDSRRLLNNHPLKKYAKELSHGS